MYRNNLVPHLVRLRVNRELVLVDPGAQYQLQCLGITVLRDCCFIESVIL